MFVLQTNASTLFDQVCNEKIQQFDDQDSEEDLWEDKEITFSQSSGSRQKYGQWLDCYFSFV